MTENIKCPCCGSGNINKYHHSTFSICEKCQCSWDESKRQPSAAWIPVSERLPAYDVRVLFMQNGVVCLGHLRPTAWYDLITRYHLKEVAYWQYLPQPPVMGKDGE